jgi:hypothetical protein
MNRSRSMLYGGLFGVLVWLTPHVETVALPLGEEVRIGVGVFTWLRYYDRVEQWSEGGKDMRRESSGTRVSLVNPSIFAGLAGLGLMVAYWWGIRSLGIRETQSADG